MAPRTKKDSSVAKPKATKTAKPKPPPKKTAKAKPANVPKRKPIPEPQTPIKKPMLRRNPDGSTPEWDKNIRSQAERKRTSFRMTRASLLDESINEESIDALFQSLNADSFAKLTWGMPSSGVQAPKQKKTISLMRGRPNFTGSVEERYNQLVEQMKEPVQKAVPNEPGRSPLLRLSFEVREHIYKYLLICRQPILLKPDLERVELNVAISNSIRRTCKVLYSEGTTYLLKHNTIVALFRKTSRAHNHTEHALIPRNFVTYFRNIIFDFNDDCWNMDWYEKATKTMQTLFEAKATISCFTLVVRPKRVGLSTTAFGLATTSSGMESSPVTFADLVWYDGDFQNALRNLAPRIFRLIIRKGTTKQLTVEINLTRLSSAWKQSIELMNEATEQILVEREKGLEMQLKDLRDTFHEIFEDDISATRAGLCTSSEPLPELQVGKSREPEFNTFEHCELSNRTYLVIDSSSEDETEDEERYEVAFEDDPQEICTDIDGSEDDLSDECE